MVNRVMQAKGQKVRRQRRAWAIPLSIASGTRPNRGVIQEYKERTCMLGVPEYEIDMLIKALYGRDPIQGVPPARAEVLATLARLKKLVPELYFFEVLDTPYHRVVCFHNGAKTCYIISHTDKKKKFTETSVEHHSKEIALWRFHNDKITWVSTEPIEE